TENVSDIIDQTNDGSSSQSALVSIRCDLDPDQLAAQILERDRVLFEVAPSFWLQNGLDLIEAKRLVGHGNFEAWCKAKLNYSKSKTEKLMRAAALFGSMLESGNLTDLPPRSLVYELSAPSFPQKLRDEFVPRLIAGERAALKPAKAAVKMHREAKKAERRTVRTSEEQALPDNVDATHTKQFAREEAKQQAVYELRLKAREAAAALIFAEMGASLLKLLEHVAHAGPGEVFGFELERELRQRALSAEVVANANLDSMQGDNSDQPSIFGDNDPQSLVSEDEIVSEMSQDKPAISSSEFKAKAGRGLSEIFASENPTSSLTNSSHYSGRKLSMREHLERRDRQY
ncbi:DUF3102 domain-containing protein, partial [Streptomyces sp. NPDC017988]